MYEVRTYAPESAARSVTAEELPDFYQADHEPVFTYGDGTDSVVIVSVHRGFCTVSLLHDRTWYWLAESPATELVEIQLCGQDAWVPAGVMARPEVGLAALRLADNVPRLLTEFTWREQ
jgi:hypothetical protein